MKLNAESQDGLISCGIGSRPMYQERVDLLSDSLRFTSRRFLAARKKGEPTLGLVDSMKATASILVTDESRLDLALMVEDLALEGTLGSKDAVLDTYLSTMVNGRLTRLTPKGIGDLNFYHMRMGRTGGVTE